MAADFNKAADNFFKSPAGSKFSSKKSDFSKLVDSPDGRKVKNMLDKDGSSLMEAVEKGDIDSLKSTLSNVLKTEEGARLAEQVMKLMK